MASHDHAVEVAAKMSQIFGPVELRPSRGTAPRDDMSVTDSAEDLLRAEQARRRRLTTAEIARAYLVPEATMGQHISRAKNASPSTGHASGRHRRGTRPSGSAPSSTSCT